MIIGVTSFVPTINVVSENVNEIVHSFIHAITDVKLFNPSQILPGYDIVTCLEDPKTPFRLFNNMLIGVARDPRKPPITKISVSAVDQSIKCSTQEYFRMGKPIYEIYGKREDSWPALKLYHCENVQEAVKYGKIAIIKLNQSGFLLACLEPIYTMGLQSDIQVENSVINPSCDIIPDIKTFIFPQGPEIRRHFSGGISFSGNVLTDAEGNRYHASNIYYYKKLQDCIYAQSAISIVSDFEAPYHDFFQPMLLELLCSPEAQEQIIVQLLLSREIRNDLICLPKEPYPCFPWLLDHLSLPTLIDVFKAILLEERIVIVGSRSDLLDAMILMLTSLLYPLKWNGILISCVPTDLLQVVLEAPCSSILIGVLSETFDHVMEPFMTEGHPFEGDLWVLNVTNHIPKLKRIPSAASLKKPLFLVRKWSYRPLLPSAMMTSLPFAETLAQKLQKVRKDNWGIRFSFHCLILELLQNHCQFISLLSDGFDEEEEEEEGIKCDIDAFIYHRGISETCKPFYRKFLGGTMFQRFLAERASNNDSFNFFEKMSGRKDIWYDDSMWLEDPVEPSYIQRFMNVDSMNSRSLWDCDWILLQVSMERDRCSNSLEVGSVLRPRSKSNTIVEKLGSDITEQRTRSQTVGSLYNQPLRSTSDVLQLMTDIFYLKLWTNGSLFTFDSAYQSWCDFRTRYFKSQNIWLPSVSKIYAVLASLASDNPENRTLLAQEMFHSYGRRPSAAVTLSQSSSMVSSINGGDSDLVFSMVCRGCRGEHSFMDILTNFAKPRRYSCRYCTSQADLEPLVAGNPLIYPQDLSTEITLIRFYLTMLERWTGQTAESLKMKHFFLGYIDRDVLVERVQAVAARNAILSLKSGLFGQAIKNILYARGDDDDVGWGSWSSNFSLFWLLAALNELDIVEGESLSLHLVKLANPRFPLTRLLREYLKIICYIEPCLLARFDRQLDAAPAFSDIRVYSQFRGLN